MKNVKIKESQEAEYFKSKKIKKTIFTLQSLYVFIYQRHKKNCKCIDLSRLMVFLQKNRHIRSPSFGFYNAWYQSINQLDLSKI